MAVPAEIVGRRAGDPSELVATSGKARELLGWVPKYSDVDDGVNRKNREWNFPAVPELEQQICG